MGVGVAPSLTAAPGRDEAAAAGIWELPEGRKIARKLQVKGGEWDETNRRRPGLGHETHD